MAVPTLDYGVIDLGVVNDENVDLQNNLFTHSLPGKNSESSVSLDVLGKQRIITLEGIKKGTESELKTFVETINDWANADIQERKVFTDSLGISYYVRCDRFKWHKTTPTKIEYTLVLHEAGIL